MAKDDLSDFAKYAARLVVMPLIWCMVGFMLCRSCNNPIQPPQRTRIDTLILKADTIKQVVTQYKQKLIPAAKIAIHDTITVKEQLTLRDTVIMMQDSVIRIQDTTILQLKVLDSLSIIENKVLIQDMKKERRWKWAWFGSSAVLLLILL